jgi:hypothetical protein
MILKTKPHRSLKEVQVQDRSTMDSPATLKLCGCAIPAELLRL